MAAPPELGRHRASDDSHFEVLRQALAAVVIRTGPSLTLSAGRHTILGPRALPLCRRATSSSWPQTAESCCSTMRRTLGNSTCTSRCDVEEAEATSPARFADLTCCADGGPYGRCAGKPLGLQTCRVSRARGAARSKRRTGQWGANPAPATEKTPKTAGLRQRETIRKSYFCCRRRCCQPARV